MTLHIHSSVIIVHPSHYITTVIKPRVGGLRSTHEEIINAYRILAGILHRKRTFRRTRHRQEFPV